MVETAEIRDSRVMAEMGGLGFINTIDRHLRVVAGLRLATKVHHCIRLDLRLFYDGQSAGALSFELEGFSPAEGVALARNIGGNQLIMREIDHYLCGDVGE
ncbi:hypothetical protein ADIMK_2930 [Marinobacterium lacunae]|uniref:Uncharacterized protein n=1 Tax=Marinobacterium lacunae TaxID=1232683 RepID=A0A081FWQ5_9GAMM|nr:hypothetical protein [Marinobacterium lacunae]KEA62960.1 hypothetical protein ADIMK_2930 [Marinobacterium lacunae]MBR9883749.1 hypothetical protein [Oceanospirillales bacterium]